MAQEKSKENTHVETTCPIGTFGGVMTLCRSDCAKFIKVERLGFEGCADKLVPILIFECLKLKGAV